MAKTILQKSCNSQTNLREKGGEKEDPKKEGEHQEGRGEEKGKHEESHPKKENQFEEGPFQKNCSKNSD